MNFIAHLLVADIRHHRIWLSVWLLVLTLATVVDGVQPILGHAQEVRDAVGVLGYLVWASKLLLLFALVPSVTQTHPAVGTDVFWMTRPIPARTLLASKTVLIAASFVIAPVAAEIALMVSYAVPPVRAVAVAAESALSLILWVALFTAAAAVTRNLAQYFLLWGGTLAALALLIATDLALDLLRARESIPSSASELIVDPTTALLLSVLISLSAAALVYVQYRTRSRIRSVTAGAGAALLALAIAAVWPWPVLRPQLLVPAWATRASSLTLSVNPDSVRVADEWWSTSGWRQIRAHVRVSGVAPAWSCDVGVLEAALHSHDGGRLVSPYSVHPVPAPTEWDTRHPERGVIQRLLDVSQIWEEVLSSDEPAITLLYAREPDLARLEGVDGAYRGRFRVALSRHAIEAVLPLRQGAQHRYEAYELRLDGADLDASRVLVYGRELDARSVFERQPPSRFSYYLRLRSRGIAVLGSPAYDSEGGMLLMGRLLPSVHATTNMESGFHVRSLILTFGSRSRKPSRPVWLDDEWLRNGELVIVRTTREGWVERSLEVPDLAIGAGPPEQSGSVADRHDQETP